MARKKEISYFTDLNTNEEFDKFLEQDVLIGERLQKILKIIRELKITSFHNLQMGYAKIFTNNFKK